METVKFVHMADGTVEDYALLDRLEEQFTDGLPGRILEHLEQLEGFHAVLVTAMKCKQQVKPASVDELDAAIERVAVWY